MKNTITITKTKQLFLTGLLLIAVNISAQEILQPTNEKSYTEYIDKILQNIKLNDVDNIKNGILYDRVFPVAKLETFNDSLNTSNYEHFLQSWNELSKAEINQSIKTINEIEKIAFHFEKENKIQIGLINVDFTVIDTTSLKNNDKKLEIVNNKVLKIPNKNPYITKHALVISPINSSALNGNTINFEIGKFVINKSDRVIESLTAHFENNQNFTLIENSLAINSNFDVDFQNSGLKEIIFNVTYLDNTTQTTYANFYINTSLIANRTSTSSVSSKQFITATKPFQGYDEPSNCNGNCYGKGEYKVYFANGNTQITKPIIILDGFDPGDKRKIDGDEAIDDGDEHLYGMMFYNQNNDNLVWDLNSEGYDVILLNFPNYVIGSEEHIIYDQYDYEYDSQGDQYITIDVYRDGGTDYVERNAKVLEALINEINTNLNNSNPIKVIGPSMGALIAQYAISEMEEDNEIHNVDLYVSFDGPHKGANISIGMQKALKYFDIYSALKSLKSPAAKQFLINHFLSYSEGLPQGAPNFRNRFQTELDRIGFPQQCRNVAVINGSIIGEEKSNTDGTFVYGELSAFWTFLNRKIWVNYTKDDGQKIVFRYLKKNFWGANTQSDTKKRSSSSSNYGSLDNASGGYIGIKDRIEIAASNSFPMTNLGGHGFSQFNFESIEYDDGNENISWLQSLGLNAILTLTGTAFYVDMSDDFCFIPTKSSLSFNGTNKLWRECLGNRNLSNTGETPFDSYYAPTDNQKHTNLQIESVAWLLDEIDGNYQDASNASVYCNTCSNSTVNINITGPHQMCLNEITTYSVNSANQCNVVNWSTSNNLQIVNNNNNDLSVKLISNTGNKWVSANINGTTKTKEIFSSNPSITTSVIRSSNRSFIEVIGDRIGYNQQNITDITWTQTGGNGILHSFHNLRNAYANGSGSWYVSGQIQVTNSCGTTTKNFALGSFIVIDPCDDGNSDNDIYLQKINQNEFSLLNPCTNQTQYINNSELFNIYGVKTHDITPSQNNIDFNNLVNSGEIKVLKVNVQGKVLTKTIITD